MDVRHYGMGMALAAALAGCTAVEATRYNWDEIGQRFCQQAVAENPNGLGAILTPELQARVAQAQSGGAVPPRLLLQAYDVPAAGCSVRTRNAALVEVRRQAAGGASWTDRLVMVPEMDGSTRIDDILFATRASDTLRERLRLILGGPPTGQGPSPQ